MKAPKDVLSGLKLSDLKSILSYDPLTGVFLWRQQLAQRWPVGTLAGAKRDDGYVSIGIRNEKFLAHRLAWFYVHGSWPSSGIDHINGNPSDNRLCNLREATPHQNHGNLKTPINNTSGRRGVWRCKRREIWCAEIMVMQKKKHLGYYANFSDAIAAREIAELKYFGAFAGTR